MTDQNADDTAVQLTTSTPEPEDHDVYREIDGSEAMTLDDLYEAFARAWNFPQYFGGNKDAFDDCMRDLDTDGGPDDRLVTVVENAEDLLADADDDDFNWFAGSMDFYRDDYTDRDDDERRDFVLILVTDEKNRAAVAARWREAGVLL